MAAVSAAATIIMKSNLMKMAAAAGFTTGIILFTGCAAQPNITARQDSAPVSVDQVQAGYDTLGRRWGEAPAPAPAPVPAPMPAAGPKAAG